jgi:hypothetical protein
VAEARDLLRRRIREVLVPGSSPIGEPGSGLRVREVQGNLESARQFFSRLEEMGEVVNVPGYPGGLMVCLGNEGRVGLRSRSKSGPPAIDVGLNCVPEIRRIHFV